jgi:hypothetical protein
MDEKFKKYLPIGSVVLMKDAKKRVMITGYAVTSPETGNKVWDYIGCLYPEGVISPEKNLLFDHNQINKIFALGYSDNEQKKFMTVLDKATEMRKARLEKQNLENNN